MPPSERDVEPQSPGPAVVPEIRASDRERDSATHRLQEAFAEGRLDDAEFDDRMLAALTARTRGQLDQLLTDLPSSAPGTPARAVGPAGGRAPGRFALAFKSSVRRSGRWRGRTGRRPPRRPATARRSCRRHVTPGWKASSRNGSTARIDRVGATRAG